MDVGSTPLTSLPSPGIDLSSFISSAAAVQPIQPSQPSPYSQQPLNVSQQTVTFSEPLVSLQSLTTSQPLNVSQQQIQSLQLPEAQPMVVGPIRSSVELSAVEALGVENGPEFLLSHYRGYIRDNVMNASMSKQTLHIKSGKINEILANDSRLYAAFQIDEDVGDTSLLVGKVILRIVHLTQNSELSYTLRDIYKMLRHHISISALDWIFYYYHIWIVNPDVFEANNIPFYVYKNIEEFRRHNKKKLQERDEKRKQTELQKSGVYIEPKKRGKKKASSLGVTVESTPFTPNQYSDNIVEPITMQGNITPDLFTVPYMQFIFAKYQEWLHNEKQYTSIINIQETTILRNISLLANVPLNGIYPVSNDPIKYNKITCLFHPDISDTGNLNDYLSGILDFFNHLEISDVCPFIEYHSMTTQYVKLMEGSISNSKIEKIMAKTNRSSALYMHFIIRISDNNALEHKYQYVQYNLSREKNVLKYTTKLSMAVKVEKLIREYVFRYANNIYRHVYNITNDPNFQRYILGPGHQTKISGEFTLGNVYYDEATFLNTLLVDPIINSMMFLKESRSYSKEVPNPEKQNEASRKKPGVIIYFNLFRLVSTDPLAKMLTIHIDKTIYNNTGAVTIRFNNSIQSDLAKFALCIKNIFAYYEYIINLQVSEIVSSIHTESLGNVTVDYLYDFIGIPELRNANIIINRQNLPTGIAKKKKSGDTDILVKMYHAFAPNVFPISGYTRYGTGSGNIDKWSKSPRLILDNKEYLKMQTMMGYNDEAMQKAINAFDFIYIGHIENPSYDPNGNIIGGYITVPWSFEKQYREIMYFPRPDRDPEELEKVPTLKFISIGEKNKYLSLRQRNTAVGCPLSSSECWYVTTAWANKNIAHDSKYNKYLTGGEFSEIKDKKKDGYQPSSNKILIPGKIAQLPDKNFDKFLEIPYHANIISDNKPVMQRIGSIQGVDSIFHAILNSRYIPTYYRTLFYNSTNDYLKNLITPDVQREEFIEYCVNNYNNTISIDQQVYIVNKLKESFISFIIGKMYQINAEDVPFITNLINTKFFISDDLKVKLINYLTLGQDADDETLTTLDDYLSNKFNVTTQEEDRIVGIMILLVRKEHYDSKTNILGQEMYNYTKSGIIDTLIDRYKHFNPLLYFHGLEEYFNINIFIFDIINSDNISFADHPYKMFSVRTYRPNRSTLLFTLTTKAKTKTDIYQYDLIVNRYGNNVMSVFGPEMTSLLHRALIQSDTVRTFTFSKQSGIIIRENLYSYINNDNREGLDYNLFFPLPHFYIHGQHLDNLGKLRLLAIELISKNIKFMIFTIPGQPLNALDFDFDKLNDTESMEYQYILNPDLLSIIFPDMKPTGQAVVTTKRGDITVGYWYPLMDLQYGFMIPTIPQPRNDSFPLGPNDPLRSISMSINNPNAWDYSITTDRILDLKRTLHMFTQVLSWLFILWCDEYYNTSYPCYALANEFFTNYTISITDEVDSMLFYNFTSVSIPRKFPIYPNNSFTSAIKYIFNLKTNMIKQIETGYYIQFYSATFQRKMYNIMIKECLNKKDFNNPGRWLIPHEIIEYYQTANNFINTNPKGLIFIGEEDYNRYNKSIESSPINNPEVHTIITNNLSNIYHPILYMRKIEGDTLSYILQNTRSGNFQDALLVASYWFTYKRNLGTFPNGLYQTLPHPELKFVDYHVYTNKTEGIDTLVSIDHSPGAESKPFVEIYKFNGKDVYLAMLPLFTYS